MRSGAFRFFSHEVEAPVHSKRENGGNVMMPLSIAQKGEENIIKKVGGNPEIRAHLENLGFVVGGSVTIVNALGGNIIVNVKDSRVAISEEMARRIMI